MENGREPGRLDLNDFWLEDGDLLVLKGGMLRGREMQNNLEKLSDNDDKAINYSSQKFVKKVLSEQGHRSREGIFIEKDKTVDMATLYTDLKVEDVKNPNVVKIWTHKNGQVIDFSRNENKVSDAKYTRSQHLGIYAYRVKFLKEFSLLSFVVYRIILGFIILIYAY